MPALVRRGRPPKPATDLRKEISAWLTVIQKLRAQLETQLDTWKDKIEVLPLPEQLVLVKAMQDSVVTCVKVFDSLNKNIEVEQPDNEDPERLVEDLLR